MWFVTYPLLIITMIGELCRNSVTHAQFMSNDDQRRTGNAVCDYKCNCSCNEEREIYCFLGQLGVHESTILHTPGYLSDLPYLSNQDILWTVNSSIGLHLYVFTERPFQTERSYDVVTIGQGNQPSPETELISHSGFEVPSPLLIENNNIWIRFQTDENKNSVGFLFEVVALNITETLRCEKGDVVLPQKVCDTRWDCPDGVDETNCDIIPENYGYTVTSPGYPNGYDNNIDVLWTARTETGSVFLVAFDAFQTETSFDLLQVGGGLTCKDEYDFFFSGSHIPDTIITEDNTLCLYFTSDHSISSTGFKINITTIERPVPPPTCGDRPAEGLNPRIIGGSDASLGNWPWIGSIKTSDGKHLCAASLIHPQWAVTAGHCIGQGGETVIFGNLRQSETSPFEQAFSYTPILHSRFSFLTLRNDISLLQLNQTVNVTNYVRPICLAEFENETDVYEECSIAGWGVTDYRTGSATDTLQEAAIPIIDGDTCADYLGMVVQFFPRLMICAGFHDGGVDSCEGDSGGPLICKNPDGRWDLVGITSFGIFCAFPEQPGIYTRVSTHLQFITEHVKDIMS